MKNEQLLDALNNIDDEMLLESNPFEEAALSDSLEAVAGDKAKKANPRRRRRFLVFAACAVLLLGSLGAYAAGGGGVFNIKTEKSDDGKGETTVEYTTIEDVKLPMSAFRGDIKNAPKEIRKQYDDFMALPEMQRWASSNSPMFLSKHFSMIDDAERYIGYDKLAFPKISYPATDISVQMSGYSPVDEKLKVQGEMLSSEYEKAKASEEFSLSMVTLEVDMQYSADPDFFCQSFAHFFTEHAGANYAYRMSLSEKVKLAQEQRTVNGREFSILNVDPREADEYSTELMFTDVFWTENNVVYSLHIVYDEGRREKAEEVITEWMNSFPKR